MSAAGVVKTFQRPCLWCILHRPGCAPNMVTVAVQGSDGACDDCIAIMSADIKNRAKARTTTNRPAPGGVSPCCPESAGEEGR